MFLVRFSDSTAQQQVIPVSVKQTLILLVVSVGINVDFACVLGHANILHEQNWSPLFTYKWFGLLVSG